MELNLYQDTKLSFGELSEEDIERHTNLMKRAIELSRMAVANGNHPFGALLADTDGNIILEAENTVHVDHDRTKHAELNLMQKVGAENLDIDTIKNAILYTSTEPCAMCSGSMYWVGIRKMVYACPENLLSEIVAEAFNEKLTDGGLNVPCKIIFTRAKNTVKTLGNVLGKLFFFIVINI
eukprot:TRINITY_DN4091_c0_g1_i1.p1 TRINITY_DN4091_c0_g1~~TRINITY_DN4091_c0_g1_i1.p1  ORF type:complete len:180 (-),score=44.04 TRINITY_DN4091_c0_g1_i1:122-661(-)